MPQTSEMNPVHAGNATRMAIRFTEHLSEQNSLATPAALDVLAVSGPVGSQLAELGWVTLSKAMGEKRVPRGHTRAMIRAMCDHTLAGQRVAVATVEALATDGPPDSGYVDPFAGLPVG